MNYNYKIVAYIRRTLPNYIYSTIDFVVYNNNNSTYIGYWNPLFSETQPTTEELDTVTQEEYDNATTKKFIYTKVDIFNSENDILNPQEGSYAYINGYLKVYLNSIWTNDQNINNIQKKEVVDVGSGNVDITTSNLLSGIIEGEPSGNKTWTLPTSTDIISNTSNIFVGKTLYTTFSNNSETKKITLNLGLGIKTKIKKMQILSDSSITLVFKFDNIISGQESITIFKT